MHGPSGAVDATTPARDKRLAPAPYTWRPLTIRRKDTAENPMTVIGIDLA